MDNLDGLRDLVRRFVGDDATDDSDDAYDLACRAIDGLLVPGTDRYTMEEAAALAGVDPSATQRLWRALGFPDPPDGARVAGDMDVEALRLVTDPLDGDDMVDNAVRQTRIYSAAVARITELWVDEVRNALDEGVAIGDALPAAMPQFDVERTTWLLGYVHRRLLAAGLRRELTARSTGVTAERAVAFADLVGFTTLTERIGPIELARLVERFEGLAYDTVAIHGGRVVKTIGDEVLYTAEDPAVVLRIADVMLTESAPLGLPPLRIGAELGVAVWYEGDLYGPAVNRAARIVAEAAPGSVTASDRFGRAAAQGRDWEPLGERDLKGIGPVRLVRLSP